MVDYNFIEFEIKEMTFVIYKLCFKYELSITAYYVLYAAPQCCYAPMLQERYCNIVPCTMNNYDSNRGNTTQFLLLESE